MKIPKLYGAPVSKHITEAQRIAKFANNATVKAFVLIYCSENFKQDPDGRYLIEVLDHYRFTINYEEIDAVYAAYEKSYDHAVMYVREWFYKERGETVSKEAQRRVGRDILRKFLKRYFNTTFLTNKELQEDLYSACLYHLGHAASLLVPEDAIIDTACEYIEDNYI